MKPTILIVVLSVLVSGCAVVTDGGPKPDSDYIVKAGDTIYAIAHRFGVSPALVASANGIEDPKSLQIGTVLRIPSPGENTAPVPSELATERAPRASLKTTSLAALRSKYPQMTWPVEQARLTSRFGYRALRFHEGLDLSAAEGTPIRAALKGIVVYSGNKIRGYGNTVVLRHGEILTVYGHNAENLVEVGDAVAQGETIATVGRTGRASGPHCHFEVRVRNDQGRYVAVDPAPFFTE